MDVDQWQSRLKEHFTVNGIVGGPLVDLLEAEDGFGSYATKLFHGYFVLADSFFSFFMETLLLAEKLARNSRDNVSPDFSGILMEYTSAFRSFRAAESLLIRGYPYSGYSLLRDLKDFAFIMSGIINKTTTYRKASGAEGLDAPISEGQMPRLRRNRQQEEKRVIKRVLASLEDEHRKKLEHWARMFHLEIHGRRLTATAGVDWMQGKTSLPLFPQRNETSIAMYLNRSHEVSWLLLRTLPCLQLRKADFGRDWNEKWGVLDDSFRIEHEARVDMGKAIAAAIIHLVNRQFRFSPEGTFFNF